MGYYFNGIVTRDRAITLMKNIKMNLKEESDVKKLSDSDKEIIKRIIDIVNSDENEVKFGRFYVGDNSMFEWGKGTLGYDLALGKISMDRIRALPTPPRSSDLLRFFKRIANLFGRVGSKRLFQEIKTVNVDRQIGGTRDYYQRL